MNDINAIVNREMRRVVSSILETKMSSEHDDERKRQERMAMSVKERGIVSDSDNSAKEQDEAEDAKEKSEDGEKREDRTGGKGTPDSKKVKTPKEEVLKSPTLGSIIDKLNALRGGKSLKDKDVKESFEQYFEGLDKTERQSLLAFLTGIAQILTGVETGSEALEPRDVGVRFKKSDVSKKETSDTKDEKGTEESPITVGENRVYDVKKALSTYRKNNGQ